MSTVNLTEVLIQIDDKKPKQADLIREHIAALPIEWVAPTTIQAELATAARLKFPLNLGDCFAYAIAKLRDDTLLTLDRDFRNTDISVLLPPRHKTPPTE
jgi:ribonuclease VapC